MYMYIAVVEHFFPKLFGCITVYVPSIGKCCFFKSQALGDCNRLKCDIPLEFSLVNEHSCSYLAGLTYH